MKKIPKTLGNIKIFETPAKQGRGPFNINTLGLKVVTETDS
jgi:hypothetical protein